MTKKFTVNKLLNSYMRVVLWLLVVISGILALAMSSRAEEPKSISYSGLLVPTADVASPSAVGGYFLTFPTGLAGQFAFSISNHATVLLYGGVLGFPPGFLASPALRIHLLRPSQKKWGLAVQAQSGVGVTFWGGEGGGGNFNALELVASSPLKPSRIHFGMALHTMPGSEYKTGWKRAKKYDFRNPQSTLFISGEHRFEKVAFSTELIWIAINADEGWDSAFAGLIGVDFSFGRTSLKVNTGVFTYRFGSGNPNTLPVPPVIALRHRF